MHHFDHISLNIFITSVECTSRWHVEVQLRAAVGLRTVQAFLRIHLLPNDEHQRRMHNRRQVKMHLRAYRRLTLTTSQSTSPPRSEVPTRSRRWVKMNILTAAGQWRARLIFFRRYFHSGNKLQILLQPSTGQSAAPSINEWSAEPLAGHSANIIKSRSHNDAPSLIISLSDFPSSKPAPISIAQPTAGWSAAHNGNLDSYQGALFKSFLRRHLEPGHKHQHRVRNRRKPTYSSERQLDSYHALTATIFLLTSPLRLEE